MSPLIISTINNGQDKFLGIRAKQAEIRFVSDQSNGLDSSLFADMSDNQYLVSVHAGSSFIFTGYLVAAGLQQPFQPDPQVIVLTASDHLPLLKDIPLTDNSGNTLQGKYRIADIITLCLAKTGLTKALKVVNNIRSGLGADGHFYDQIYIDVKTFESGIGELEDCYTILEKILGEDCFLCQWGDFWFIGRVDEYEGVNQYVASFNPDGSLVNILSQDLSRSVGAAELMRAVDADMILMYDRPHLKVKETLNYRYPLELVCNIDFDRGAVRTPPDLSAPTSKGTYDLDCWTKQQFPTSGTSIIPANNDTYIERVFTYGVETDRYIVSTAAPGAANEGVMSQPMAVQLGDKIEVSVNWRLPSNVGAGDGVVTVKAFSVLLITAVNDYYYLSQYYVDGSEVPEGKTVWIGPFNGQRNAAINYSWNAGQTDETQSVTI